MSDNNEELEKLHGDHKIPLKELLKRSVKYTKGVRHLLVFAFILLIISVGIDVCLPLLIKEFVNHLKQEDTTKIVLWTALWLVIGYTGLGISTQLFRYFEAILLQKAGHLEEHLLLCHIHILVGQTLISRH